MDTIPMSISGNFEEVLGRTTDTILANIRDIYRPLLQSSYWTQRCTEKIKHGVFYCVSLNDNHLQITPRPFWSSMSEEMMSDTQKYLKSLDLKKNLLLCLMYTPVQIGCENLKNPTSVVMLLQETKIYAGAYDDLTYDVYYTSEDLPEGMKILSQDLDYFFAHL